MDDEWDKEKKKVGRKSPIGAEDFFKGSKELLDKGSKAPILASTGKKAGKVKDKDKTKEEEPAEKSSESRVESLAEDDAEADLSARRRIAAALMYSSAVGESKGRVAHDAVNGDDSGTGDGTRSATCGVDGEKAALGTESNLFASGGAAAGSPSNERRSDGIWYSMKRSRSDWVSAISLVRASAGRLSRRSSCGLSSTTRMANVHHIGD